MREENYFEKKLEISKETLLMAKSKLEHLDVQMNVLQVRFDHDKKVYNDQIIHMQNTVSDMEKRIPELEKKIEKGFVTVDMRTGKAFRSFKARHVGLLQDKIKEAELNQKALADAYKLKQSLRKKKRDKLSDEELDVVIAEEVREAAQPADEIKANQAKEIERLEKKAEDYRQQLATLKETKETEIKEAVNEILEDAEDKIIEAVKKPETPMKVIIAEKEEIANEFRKIADDMNGETKELQWLMAKRQDWIDQYDLEEGGNAVWQGRITNGFKAWCEAKGYKIGD